MILKNGSLVESKHSWDAKQQESVANCLPRLMWVHHRDYILSAYSLGKPTSQHSVEASSSRRLVSYIWQVRSCLTLCFQAVALGPSGLLDAVVSVVIGNFEEYPRFRKRLFQIQKLLAVESSICFPLKNGMASPNPTWASSPAGWSPGARNSTHSNMEAEIFVTPALHKTQPVPCDNWVVACRGQGVSGGYGCLIPCEGGIRFFYGLPRPSSLSGALTKYDKNRHSDERFSFSSQLQDTVHASRDSVGVKSRETWKPSCSVLSFLCCYPSTPGPQT